MGGSLQATRHVRPLEHEQKSRKLPRHRVGMPEGDDDAVMVRRLDGRCGRLEHVQRLHGRSHVLALLRPVRSPGFRPLCHHGHVQKSYLACGLSAMSIRFSVFLTSWTWSPPVFRVSRWIGRGFGNGCSKPGSRFVQGVCLTWIEGSCCGFADFVATRVPPARSKQVDYLPDLPEVAQWRLCQVQGRERTSTTSCTSSSRRMGHEEIVARSCLEVDALACCSYGRTRCCVRLQPSTQSFENVHKLL